MHLSFCSIFQSISEITIDFFCGEKGKKKSLLTTLEIRKTIYSLKTGKQYFLDARDSGKQML